MDLFRKADKTKAEIDIDIVFNQILYKEQFPKLEPFIKLLTLQSHSEYLEVTSQSILASSKNQSCHKMNRIICTCLLRKNEIRLILKIWMNLHQSLKIQRKKKNSIKKTYQKVIKYEQNIIDNFTIVRS